jgi:diacylglycerol kinase family enzyme
MAVLTSLSAANVLGLTAVALRGGAGFDRRRKVTLVTDVVRAVLSPYSPVPYQVDGDFLGDTEHLEFRWEPDYLRLILPRR